MVSAVVEEIHNNSKKRKVSPSPSSSSAAPEASINSLRRLSYLPVAPPEDPTAATTAAATSSATGGSAGVSRSNYWQEMLTNPNYKKSPDPVVDLTGGGGATSRSRKTAKTTVRGGGGDGGGVPDLVFSVGILLESDEKPQCFRNDAIEPMQTQHRCVEWTVPADGAVVNLGACIDKSVVLSWMERNNQRNNEAFSFCAYAPLSTAASDRSLRAITEASSTNSAPGKKIGFSKCGTLFSANFTTVELSRIVLRMKEKKVPQLYLGICALTYPVDDSSPVKVISPNSFKHQTRAMKRQEGNN